MDYHSTLQDIRRRCRKAMNGDASAGMRKYGLTYKLNFGLMISQIREIAKLYEPDAGLADLLWNQDTRELKILATLLYPVDELTEELADKWAMEISNQEIREQITINMFQQIPFAQKLAIKWIDSTQESLRTTGYWLIGRLLISRKAASFQQLDRISKIWQDVFSEDVSLRNSVLVALKQIGRAEKDYIPVILTNISGSPCEKESLKKEIYDSLSFEFDFFA